MKKAKELYGYDLEFSYIDLGEGDEVAFKWDDKAKRYMVVEPELYAHGNMYMDIEWRIKDIKKYDDNTYDVTTRQLWTDELSEGDPIENLYFYYGNAKSATDPVFSISSEESYKLKYDEIFEKAFKSVETKKDGGFYTYRIIKEKGVIKIIQYVID